MQNCLMQDEPKHAMILRVIAEEFRAAATREIRKVASEKKKLAVLDHAGVGGRRERHLPVSKAREV